MMCKRASLLLGALALGALLLIPTGCTTRLVDFTMISTKNVDLSQAATFKRARNRVEGKDYVHIIIIIPTGVPNMKEAIDRAIESVPGGVALMDGVLVSKFFYIPYIYGRSAYVVEGTPLIDPALASAQGAPEAGECAYRVIECNRHGEVVSARAVTQGEYRAIQSESGIGGS